MGAGLNHLFIFLGKCIELTVVLKYISQIFDLCPVPFCLLIVHCVCLVKKVEVVVGLKVKWF